MISFIIFQDFWFPSQLNNHLLGIFGVVWTELIIYKLFFKANLSAQWLGLIVKFMKIFSLYVCIPAGWNMEWFPFGVMEAVFKFRMFSKNSDKWLAPFQALEYLVVMVSIIFPVSTTSVSAFVASWVPDSYAGISSHYHSELLSRLTRYLGLHEFSADSNASTLKRCNDNSWNRLWS